MQQTINIDGAVSGAVNWVGGSAPSTGGSSGLDIYSYQIIKTADSTFTVIGNLTNAASVIGGSKMFEHHKKKVLFSAYLGWVEGVTATLEFITLLVVQVYRRYHSIGS